MAGGKSNRCPFPPQAIRDTYAFVIDGEDEKWYLQLLKTHETSVRVDIKPELNLNKTIEEQYELVYKGVIAKFKTIKGSPLSDYNKSEAYYKKKNNDIYKKLKPYLATARCNAKKLGIFDISNMQKGLSEMYVIFDELGI